MSEQTNVITVEKVSSTEGAKNGKPWRKWAVKDGEDNWYSTFDGGLGDTVSRLEGQRAEIVWKPSGNEGQFKDLVKVTALALEASDWPESNGGGPSAAKWDEIGLRKTRCLLWAHYLGSDMARAIVEATTDGSSKADAVYRIGERLITLAESDIYTREPAVKDAAIPFAWIDGYDREPGVHFDPWRR